MHEEGGDEREEGEYQIFRKECLCFIKGILHHYVRLYTSVRENKL